MNVKTEAILKIRDEIISNLESVYPVEVAGNILIGVLVQELAIAVHESILEGNG